MARLALCIVINNCPGPGVDSNGWVNDATDWGATLAARGHAVRAQLDAKATKAAMVAGAAPTAGSAFRSVVASAPCDLLLSECREGRHHDSDDASLRGRPNGAGTFDVLKTLQSLPAAALYADWHRRRGGPLPSANVPQSPPRGGQNAAGARMMKRRRPNPGVAAVPRARRDGEPR